MSRNLIKFIEIAIFRFGNKRARARIARRWGLRVGDDCDLISMSFGSEPYLISIGNRCTITSGVRFITHDGGIRVLRNMESFKGTKFGTITIHDNCFIGPNTIILPNVVIGPNCVIGAGSVVTKNIPPNNVYAGNPAKLICTLDEYRIRCLANIGNLGDGSSRSDEREKEIKKFFRITR